MKQATDAKSSGISSKKDDKADTENSKEGDADAESTDLEKKGNEHKPSSKDRTRSKDRKEVRANEGYFIDFVLFGKDTMSHTINNKKIKIQWNKIHNKHIETINYKL